MSSWGTGPAVLVGPVNLDPIKAVQEADWKDEVAGSTPGKAGAAG
jgi:hypothetical protein